MKLYLNALFALLLSVGGIGTFDHLKAQTAAEFETMVRQAQDSFGVPGLAVGIIKDGKIVMSQGFGIAKAGETTPVNANTLFAIASNTKAFIGTAAAMLDADKKLSLDDLVSTHLPYLKYSDANVTALANVADLMTHRIGLGTFEGDHLWFKKQLTPKQVLTKVESMPLRYPFRVGYGYSNLGFIAAGEVISKTAGITWQEMLQQRIFTPLQMTRTTLKSSQIASMSNVASGHITRQGNIAISPVSWELPGAAGGIWSSVDDMLKWVSCNLDTGMYQGDTVWTHQVARTVWTPRNTFGSNENFTSYGLGWFMRKVGDKTVVSHGGGYDGMYSQVQLVPAAKLGIVVLSNSMTGISSALATEIRNRYLGTPKEDWLSDAMARQRKGDQTWFARQDSVRYFSDNIQDKPSYVPINSGAYIDPVFGAFDVTRVGSDFHVQFPDSKDLRATLTATPSGGYLLDWQGEATAWFDGGFAYVKRNTDGEEVLQFYIPNDDIFFEWIAAVRDTDE